jgi:hypothetical protein
MFERGYYTEARFGRHRNLAPKGHAETTITSRPERAEFAMIVPKLW